MQYDRPGVFAVAAICFGIILVRCWWQISRLNRQLADLQADAYRRRFSAAARAERSLN